MRCIIVSQSDIDNNNKHRATTLPIWDYIKESFNIKEFLQIDTPLERIKRAAYTYDYYKFKDECIALIRKAHLNSVPISNEELEDCLSSYVKSLHVSKEKPYQKDYIDVEVKDKDDNKEKFRLLKSGEIIKPINVISVSTLSDSQLLHYLDDLTSSYELSDKDNKKHEIVYDELVRRGLKEPIPF